MESTRRWREDVGKDVEKSGVSNNELARVGTNETLKHKSKMMGDDEKVVGGSRSEIEREEENQS